MIKVWINIKCAFGKFNKKFGLLHKVMCYILSIRKITTITIAFFKLHNFIINQSISLEDIVPEETI